MKQDKPILLHLKEIEASQNFDALECYSDPQFWGKMSDLERHDLAKLFLKKARFQIEKGDPTGVDSFKKALHLAGNDPVLLLEHARTWAKFQNNVRCLQEASQSYANVVQEAPLMLDAWLEWGEVLLELGVGTSSPQVLQESHRIFSHAQKLAADQQKEFPAKRFWQWGLAWHYLGKHSGEAQDIDIALQYYQKAFEKGLEEPFFYYDMGEGLSHLANLLKRDDLLLQSVEWFQKCVNKAPHYFDAWYDLAIVYKYLFENEVVQQYFDLAEQAFFNAARVNPNHALLLFRWAELLTLEARIKHDPDLMLLGLQKFENADALDPNNAIILLRWGDAYLTLGAWEDRLDYLQEAKEKIQQSLLHASENVHAWWVYGNCLIEIGNYFDHEEYYYEAIRKFEYGLTLDEKYPFLFIGLGSASFALGDLKEDIKYFEKALEYYAKAVENGAGGHSQLWNDWGVCLMKLAEYKSDMTYLEEAVNKFELAISYRKDRSASVLIQPEVYYNYACALDFLGDIHEETNYYEKSIAILFQIVNQHPEYYNARYHLALALSHLGTHTGEVELLQKAAECFAHLVELDPEDELAWNDWGLILITLAQLMQDPCNMATIETLHLEAETKFLQAIALGNQDADYNLACLYSLMGNYHEAMHYLQRAKINDSLPALEDLLHDEWLESLRHTQGFRHFLAQLPIKSNEEP